MSDKEAQLEQLSMYTHDLHDVKYFGDEYGDEYGDYNDRPLAPIETATVFSSKLAGQGSMHTVAIDLDLPATLVPSSTPGHHHLYVDQPMDWMVYVNLLNALVEAGLVQPGYRDASIRRGATYLRLPWIRKDES